MEFEISIPSSQKLATCPDPEPEPYSPHFPTDFFNTLFDVKKKTIILFLLTSQSV